jgi:hypothetical protein
MSLQQEIPISVIATSRTHADLAPETLASQATVTKRTRQVATMIPNMIQRLTRLFAEVKLVATHGRLVSFGQFLVDHYGRKRMDRLAKRLKPALICWFCEQCPDLLDSPVAFNRYMADLHSQSQAPRAALPGVAEIMRTMPAFASECPQGDVYTLLNKDMARNTWFL